MSENTKNDILKSIFVFATAIILCHLASHSVFARLMTLLLKEIMAPIISFHYEMKLSWKRMRKFHTLEIRFCKCCVRIPGYEHIKSHFFCPPLCSCSVIFLWQTDKNLQWTANWTAKSHFQGLTALFLLLIYIFFWQYRGFVHLYILVKRRISFFVFN